MSAGGVAPVSLAEMLALAKLKEAKGGTLKSQEMVGALLSDHEALIVSLRAGLDTAQAKFGDAGTAGNGAPDRQRSHGNPPARRLGENPRLARTEKLHAVPARGQPVRLGKDADLLAAPAEGGLGMDDPHAAARSAAYCIR